MLDLRTGAATDVGRVRSHNEDSLLVDRAVFAVADGMGGHAAGEVASRIAIDALRRLSERATLVPDDIAAALRQAQDLILRSSSEHPEQAGMGTTVTGVAVVEVGGSSQWAVFNLGDSRVYHYREDRLRQVTVDHSEVQELVDAGLLTRAEADRHPLRNLITRALGSDEPPEVDLWVLPPQAGDRFLACTDGLTGELDDSEIAMILGTVPDPQGAAEALVAAAVRAGGRDNVTVVVVDAP